MRRFVLSLSILMVLSVSVFLVGWVSLRVPAGSYAVYSSKTGGVDTRVVAPGEFWWNAGMLLPTNVRLIVLKPVEVERTVELSGELPSASTYAEFMAGTPDFSFAISVRLFAAPKAGYLPELYRRWGVEDDEALAAWLDDEIDLAAADLRASIVSSAEGLLSLDEAELAGVVAARHPALDVRGVSVVSSRVPDLGLYEEARRLYAAYMQAYRASVEPALADASATAAGEQVRMESLARYGELLERYPGLIDYLAIEAGIAPRPQVIQSAGN